MALRLRHFPLLALFLPQLIRAGAIITDFQAVREQNAILVSWASEQENNVSKFTIERSTDLTNWAWVGDVTAFGESSVKRTYQFKDKNLYKSNQATFYYRLKITDKNGRSVIYDAVLSANGYSGIRHTWGSIKAMFR
jgi:hypothetical protein